MGRRWGAGMSLATVALLALVLLPACGLGHKRPEPGDDTSDFAADRLDLSDEDPFFDDLDPAERRAVERSGIGAPRPASEDADAAPQPESKSETAGKVGLSVLSVAMTIGAAVAPFLLF